MNSIFPDNLERLRKAGDHSFFLFGPRGTGKSHWLRHTFKNAPFIDLLESDTYRTLNAAPERLESILEGAAPHKEPSPWIVIDEIQRVPALLNEVHRLIETKQVRFAMSGSSARKLKTTDANLLAGRARTHHMHPLTARELGEMHSLKHSLRFGQLPSVYLDNDPRDFISSYVHTYIQEEVAREGLVRNLGDFHRFLETASFSQGSTLNLSEVARDSSVNRKTAEGYFQILEDILLATRLTPFTRRAKRKTVVHPKFFFFDTGVFRALRPRGPLDSTQEIEGAALETLIFQELRAWRDYALPDHSLNYWRTHQGHEIDFVLYGESGLFAFEVKRKNNLQKKDLKSLSIFKEEFPPAQLFCLYGGKKSLKIGDVRCVPIPHFLRRTLPEEIAGVC